MHHIAVSAPTSSKEKTHPEFRPTPQFWIAKKEVSLPFGLQWTLSFRDIARPTDARTTIASIIPGVGIGDTAVTLIPDTDKEKYIESIFMVTGNMNAFSFDYLARQKVPSAHLKWFMLEQLPFLPPESYEQKFGAKTAADIVRDHVLRLSYTATDLTPFARDLGYDGPPFIWNEVERRHLRARLDALYFLLYGINRDDADYILSTFPIVRREDEAAFGTYLTRDMILAYMRALEAGDSETTLHFDKLKQTA